MPRKSFGHAVVTLLGACTLCLAPVFAQSSNSNNRGQSNGGQQPQDSSKQPADQSHQPAAQQSEKSSDTGKLKIHVTPKQAYVFVDGQPVRDGSQTIKLPAGGHKIEVHNYGYAPNKQDVTITGGKTTDLNVTLQASGDKVSGPFGDIEFKGHPRAAVMLNGDTPDYFVGHVDEFNWDWIWHQRLLVHPGTYDVNIKQKDKTVWTGQVTAKAGERTIVYLNKNGKTKTKEWKEGLNMQPQPRFAAGIASAEVPIAPVSAQLTAQNTSLKCGDQSDLKWNTADAVDTFISNIGNVPPQGDKTVSPTKSETYVLTAKGPGGTATQSVDVGVDVQPTASITLSQPDIHYHKIGDKVVQQDSTTLTWSSSNANSVQVTPLGKQDLTGNQTITAQPKQENEGPVNDTETYAVTATNACGGTATQTATLHVTGSIDPPPALALTSTFYPTAYPTEKHPKDGLLDSEAKALDDLADHFKDYQQYDHKGTLLIVAHTDVRGSDDTNQALSERRAELVKEYLISKGVPEDKIQVKAVGKSDQLDQDKVETLQTQDSAQPQRWMDKGKNAKKATWLAYNRRADIILEPRGTESKQEYPNDVADVRLLWQQTTPPIRKVQKAEQNTSAALSAKAATNANSNSNPDTNHPK
jgi:outer membrane protein OmpA-like peptidoglycan-associated protein